MLTADANVPAMKSRSRRERHAPPGCWSRNNAVNETTPHRSEPAATKARGWDRCPVAGWGANR
jgi:hypothetical protein